MWIKIVNPNSRKQIPDAKGVYCFFESASGIDKIVYIGSTSNLKNRIPSHDKFDHPYKKNVFVKIKKCDNPDTIERRLIKKLRPPLNHLVNGKIAQHKSISSLAWTKKLERQRIWREKKKTDRDWMERQRSNFCKWKEKFQQSDEYRAIVEQRQTVRAAKEEHRKSDARKDEIKRREARHYRREYHKKPGYYREKKNLFKIFGTKSNISFPLRKSIALVHLGRRLTKYHPNSLPVEKEKVAQIIARINTGDTYAAYE